MSLVLGRDRFGVGFEEGLILLVPAVIVFAALLKELGQILQALRISAELIGELMQSVLFSPRHLVAPP
ncbi:hypothetical protein BRAS3843_2120005 [Bradyrhizobium sp. STM 3843]|nr:hypothetical protein BRAS3843_2120005 [Bradyrhizobium sp. STM 3843]